MRTPKPNYSYHLKLNISNFLQKHNITQTSSMQLKSFFKRTRLPMQETQEMWVRFLYWEDTLEEEMTTHSTILA